MQSFLLRTPGGLHARPAVKLTMLANAFSARIEMAARDDGRWVDAKSIVRVMGLKIGQGDVFHLRAGGEDAEQALSALAELAARGFDEPADDLPPEVPLERSGVRP